MTAPHISRALDGGALHIEPPRPERAKAYLTELASGLLDTRLTPIALPRSPVADAKQTWILLGASDERRAVAQISNAVNPGMVARGVARAQAVRAALEPAERTAVLTPFADGTFEGASFAIWHFCQPIPHRRPDVIARRAFMRPVFDWLREAARATARSMTDAAVHQVERQLCAMATQPRLSVHVRLAARAALRRIDEGVFRPRHVAMHGDFHAGNLLFDHLGVSERALLPPAQRFVIIDWCGATLDGWPLIDLLRMAESLRAPNEALARELAAHCTLLGGELDDAAAHVTCGLANLGANLEHFPIGRYAELCQRVLSRLDDALRPYGVR